MSSTFPSRVHGIPCQVHVVHFIPSTPAISFELLDRRGRRAKWLERYVTPKVEEQIAEEHHILREGEFYEFKYGEPAF